MTTTSLDRLQAGQVDAGGHFAHSRRTEHSERDAVSNNADEDDERSDVGVDILAALEKHQVRLHASVTTRQSVT